jgi:hypothetical protein
LQPDEIPAATAGSRMFADSLESLDFPDTTPPEWTAREERFAAAVRQAQNGRYDAAANALRAFAEESDDSGLRQQARDAAGEILFGQDRWTDFLQDRDRYSEALFDDLPLAGAWRDRPPEIATFRDSPEAIPLHWSALGVPEIEVTVNGRRRRFWLDTGAGRTVLSSTTAAACRVEPLGPATTADTAAASTVPVRPAMAERLEVGPLVLEHHPVLIIAQSHLEFRATPSSRPVRIDGLLGWNALRRVAVTLDGPGRRLLLRPPSTRPADPRNLFRLGLTLVRAEAPDGRPLLLHLDTGAGRSSLTARGLARLGVPAGRTQTATLFVAGGPRTVAAREARDVSLLLDGWRLDWPRLRAYPERTHLFYALDGTLGSDALRQTVATIDGTNGRFRLEARPDGPPREERPGGSGDRW